MRKFILILAFTVAVLGFPVVNYALADNVTVLEQMDLDSRDWAVIRAKTAIKRSAHDPGSIRDVQPITDLLKVKIKGMPNCHFVIQVQYRGKNALGAMVLNQATIMFDNNYNVINISLLH